MIAKLDKSGKNIANISDDDINAVCFLENISNGRQYVQLSFDIPGKERAPQVLVPMSAVNTKDILNYLPEEYVIRFSSSGQQAAYMRQRIYDAQSAGLLRYNMISQGYNKTVDGRLLYGLGDLVVGASSKSSLRVFNPNNLRVNRRLIKETTPLDLFRWVSLWTSQDLCLSALLIVALSPFVYPIIKELSPQSEALNGYLVGRTGSGKTSYGTLVTDLFQGRGSSISLISHKDDFFKIIKDRSYTSILIDDLNKSSSSQENYKKIGKLSELIQLKSSEGTFLDDLAADDMKNISLIITAEEALGAPSSMNRCVVIKFPNSFNAEILTELQTNNLFPALVYRLIEWICRHQNAICELVAREFRNRKNLELPYQNIVSAGDSRICMSYRTMLVTQTVLEKYFKQCMGAEEIYYTNYNKLSKALTRGVEEAIRNTKEASRALEENNVLSFFVDLFKYDVDCKIAKNAEEYFTSKDKLIFFYEGYYYFQGSVLQSYMQERYYKISSKRLSEELKKLGLLKTRKGECSFPLPKKLRREYGQEGVRYYCLYSDALHSLVSNKCDNIIELFGTSLSKYK